MNVTMSLTAVTVVLLSTSDGNKMSLPFESLLSAY